MRFFLTLFFALLPIVSSSAKTCSEIFLAHTMTPAGLPVFRALHKNYAERGTDGPTFINPTRGTWQNGQGAVQAKVKFIGNDTAEPILELRSARAVPGSRYEFYSLLGPGFFPSNLGGQSLVGHSTGLRLRVSSWDPGTEITVFVSSGLTAGPRVRSYTFKAPEQPTDISIPWKSFGLGLELADIPKEFHETTYLFGLMIKPSRRQFAVRVHGPIVYERDLESSAELRAILESADFSPGPQLGDYSKQRPGAYRDIVSLVIQNMHDPVKQMRALKLAQTSEPVVLSALRALGFHFVDLPEQLLDAVFFSAASPLNTISPNQRTGISEFAQTGLFRPVVPLETGEFAIEHERLAHAMQVLAAADGMSPLQLRQFHALYAGIFGRVFSRWAIWDILFDAPGNSGPNSPQWWRDRMEGQTRSR